MKCNKFFRVLYAANNEEDFLVLSAMLSDSDIQLEPANTVAQALQKVQAEAFDLFLLETRFPDGNGFELCEHMRLTRPETPAVFYSGDASPEDKRKGLSSGAFAYLTKPYIDVLASALNLLIS